ncbi:zonular occludens toxin domain-containing protein [Ruminococcus flavefaciens]|uniref:zonular occludens toxin domain-containing protein n=1 Tax=Ruminococcus flavefaciens TaxID=1265 RepID=UPI0026F2934C|nr:zonular occludens toxin domain-containing protein [Ruminococcus flavefaciens]
MIRLFTGVGGSSKSYHTAKLIKGCLLEKKNVIANIPINIDFVRKPYSYFKGRIKGYRHEIGDFFYAANSRMTPEMLIAYSDLYHKRDRKGNMIEGQTVVVIDECQLLFDPKVVKADRPKWVRFFCLHRHYGFDMILITQHNRLIDRQIREQCSEEVKHRLTNHNGWIGKLLPFKLYSATTVWNGRAVGAEFYVLNKKIFKIYDSYTEYDHKDMMISDTQYRKYLNYFAEMRT